MGRSKRSARVRSGLTSVVARRVHTECPGEAKGGEFETGGWDEGKRGSCDWGIFQDVDPFDRSRQLNCGSVYFTRLH